MSVIHSITIDSDSDDNDVILASEHPQKQQEAYDEDEEAEDFIFAHQRIKKILSQSNHKQSIMLHDDRLNNDILPMYFEAALAPIPNDHIVSTPNRHRNRKTPHKSSAFSSMHILDDLIPKHTDIQNETRSNDAALNHNEIKNEIKADPLQMSPIAIVATEEETLDINKKNQTQTERERLQTEEEENRKFAETFNNVLFDKSTNQNASKSTDSKHDRDQIQLQNDNAFSALFTKQNKRKRTRQQMEKHSKSEHMLENRRKRHKSNEHRANNPFDIRFPASFTPNIDSEKKKETPLRRKLWSKSQRISTPNISQIKSSHNIKSKKKRKRKREKDPFAIHVPIMTSLQSAKKKKKKITVAEPYRPLSEQLQSLMTPSAQIMDIQDATFDSNPNISTLPHSETRKKKKKHSNVEDIQETKTTNEDFDCLNTPKRHKYDNRMDENASTPYFVENMMTPKRKSDKEEMDIDENKDVEQNTIVIGVTPKWLNNLTNIAIQTHKEREKEKEKKEQLEKEKHEMEANEDKVCTADAGKWQTDLIDLQLKSSHRTNLVNTYKDCIQKIPAHLGVTETITVRLLQICRAAHYNLYQTIGVYLHQLHENTEYVLLYLSGSIVDSLKLKPYDFIQIYRPWTDMNYSSINTKQNKKHDIRVIVGIEHVIKVVDYKQIVHLDKYPQEYNIDVFKPLIMNQHHSLHANGTMSDINDTNDAMNVTIEQTQTEQQLAIDEDDENEAEEQHVNDVMMRWEQYNYGLTIDDLPPCELWEQRKEYRLSAMIQRIYIKQKQNEIQILVQDEAGYCAIIGMNLDYWIQNKWIQHKMCNDTSMKLESKWFDFVGLSMDHKMDKDYDPSVQSLLIQFQSIDTNEKSDVQYGGIAFTEGTFINDSQIYYHFEDIPACDEPNSFRFHKQYSKRLQLRYLKCKSVEAQAHHQHVVKYKASLMIQCIDIHNYLHSFWRTQRLCSRISMFVRIVARSQTYHNVLYVTDNSLSMKIQCLPLIIDDMDTDLFCAILKTKDHNDIYKSQPLVILRDIAMNFRNNDAGNDGHLELRFDAFSYIKEVKDMAMIADRRKFNYKSQIIWKLGGPQIMNIDALRNTPWIALHSSMISFKGRVELVAMNDGFDVRCIECRKVSTENFEHHLSANVDIKESVEEDQCAEGIACVECLMKKGRLRLVVKPADFVNDFVVIYVDVTRIWYEDKRSNGGINEAIKWKTNQSYISEINILKQKLNDLIGNELKQCIIEYVPSEHSNSHSMDDVQCFECLHCVV